MLFFFVETLRDTLRGEAARLAPAQMHSNSNSISVPATSMRESCLMCMGWLYLLTKAAQQRKRPK